MFLAARRDDVSLAAVDDRKPSSCEKAEIDGVEQPFD